MAAFPADVIKLISLREGAWSEHAAEDRDRLGLVWRDVEEVARTAFNCKRKRDVRIRGGLTYSGVGRSVGGSSLYMAGKKLSVEGEDCWYVITIHESGR